MILSEGFLAFVDSMRSRVTEVDIEGYLALDNKGLLIDIREDHEWAAGHIAGAMHLGKGIIERDIEVRVPDKSQRMVLYCGGGYRSVLAADALTQMGYQDVISLDGGWRGWVKAGLPTVIP